MKRVRAQFGCSSDEVLTAKNIPHNMAGSFLVFMILPSFGSSTFGLTGSKQGGTLYDMQANIGTNHEHDNKKQREKHIWFQTSW